MNEKSFFKYFAFIVAKMSALSIFFLYYYTEQFNAEYGVNIDSIKWHVILIMFIKIIPVTTLGILSIGILYSFGLASVMRKLERLIKNISFKSYKNKNQYQLSMSYRSKLKSSNNRHKSTSQKRPYRNMPLKYTITSIAFSTFIFLCFVGLLFCFIEKDAIKLLGKLFKNPQKIFDHIFWTLSIICFAIFLFFEFIYKNENVRMITQNKFILNPKSRIFKSFIHSLICLVAWMYLLIFSTVYQINAIDPFGVLILAFMLVFLFKLFIYVKSSLIKISIVFLGVFAVLLSPIGYLAFKYILNKNVYISHNKNYILINKNCYIANKDILDLNKLVHPYTRTNSLYFIESFTKLINYQKLVLKEEPDINAGEMKIYSINLINCKNIMVEDCIESFNNVCNKK